MPACQRHLCHLRMCRMVPEEERGRARCIAHRPFTHSLHLLMLSLLLLPLLARQAPEAVAAAASSPVITRGVSSSSSSSSSGATLDIRRDISSVRSGSSSNGSSTGGSGAGGTDRNNSSSVHSNHSSSHSSSSSTDGVLDDSGTPPGALLSKPSVSSASPTSQQQQQQQQQQQAGGERQQMRELQQGENERRNVAESVRRVVRVSCFMPYGSFNDAHRSAVRLASEHIAADRSLLPGHKLEVVYLNTSLDEFQPQAAAVDTLLQDVVAFIGPPFSSHVRAVVDLARVAQVPVVSHAATDPMLSIKTQFPFFVRMTHSDAVEMQAVACLLNSFGWQQVVAIYADNDFGRNGISSLSSLLAANASGATISERVVVDMTATDETVAASLTAFASVEASVFVLHMSYDLGLRTLRIAKELGMFGEGYAWVCTEGTFTALKQEGEGSALHSSLVGVLGTRSAIPSNPNLAKFMNDWKALNSSDYLGADTDVDVYTLTAYDATWLVARAIDAHIRASANSSAPPFAQRPLSAMFASDGDDEGGGAALWNSPLASVALRVGGRELLDQMQRTTFLGVTGNVSLDANLDPQNQGFVVENLDNRSRFAVVATWNAASGTWSSSDFDSIVWPGDTPQIPRGWVTEGGKMLRFAVPTNTLAQMVYVSPDGTNITGFCVEVFRAAMQRLKDTKYPVRYELVPVGYLNYNDLIAAVARKEYDGAVGDITVNVERQALVDFTMPFQESDLLMILPSMDVLKDEPNPWAFLAPFTPAMWLLLLFAFLFNAGVVWYLEHNQNLDFAAGRPHVQAVSAVWFSFATMMRSQEQRIRTSIGRFVVLTWLFLVLIVTSSYTASLTSILTVNNLSPPAQTIAAVIALGLKIGYSAGSATHNQLRALGLQESQLVPLATADDYKFALDKREGDGVVGVVEERPYADVFFTTFCGYTRGPTQITALGWAFAFHKGSRMAGDLNTVIAFLGESGKLKELRDTWIKGNSSCGEAVESSLDSWASTALSPAEFRNLFLIYFAVATAACIAYLAIILVRGARARREIRDALSEEERARLLGTRQGVFSLIAETYRLGVSWTVAHNLEGRERDEEEEEMQGIEGEPNSVAGSSQSPAMGSDALDEFMERRRESLDQTDGVGGGAPRTREGEGEEDDDNPDGVPPPVEEEGETDGKSKGKALFRQRRGVTFEDERGPGLVRRSSSTKKRLEVKF